MRIAFAGVRGVPALYSGFETAVTEIGTRLVERGHEVFCYCRTGYGNREERCYRGVKKIYLPRLNLKIADTLSHTFFSLLHMAVHPPDVALVMNPANGPLCVIPKLRGIPFAINVDGLEWKREKWPPIGRAYFHWASRVCTKVAPAIIADSRCIQQYYRDNFACPSYYASYGAYIERSSRPELLAEFALEPERYFLVVARLEPENNTDLVIKAFEQTRTDMQLAIVGGVNYKSKYVQRLQQTSDARIRFLGPVYDQEKLSEIVSNSFAYVHGHMVGGTNPMLLKALGCGARVLYLDVDFNKEVVGDVGLPFPRDVEGAAAAFSVALSQFRGNEDARELARERIRKKYTWEIVTDRYEDLCRQLVAGDRACDEESMPIGRPSN